MSKLVNPHGSKELKPLLLEGAQKDAETKKAAGLKKVPMTSRETSDLMWRLNKYQTINCDCGTRLKVPPKFKGSSVRCPHCGRTYPLK